MEVNIGISIIQNNFQRSVLCYTFPPYMGQIINRFMCYFDSIEKVDGATARIREVMSLDKLDNIGSNDYSISLSKDFVTFDLMWDKSDDPLMEFYPLQVPSYEFLDLLDKLKKFMVQFESCQIPGVIPSSKLDTWSCVPNEYVKDEWWALQEDKKGGA